MIIIKVPKIVKMPKEALLKCLVSPHFNQLSLRLLSWK